MASRDFSLNCIDLRVLASRCVFLWGGGIVVEMFNAVGDLFSEIITVRGR